MKILQLLEASATGAGRHVADLTDGLLARGHEVHLLYSPLRSDQVFANALRRLNSHHHFQSLAVPIERNPSVADIRAIRRLRRYLRVCGPFDLFHCHSTKAGFIGRVGLMGHNLNTIYTPHCLVTMDPTVGCVTRQLAGRLEKVLARLSAGVVVVSQEEYAHAVRIGIPPEKLSLIPNGVAPSKMDNLENLRSERRREWGLKDADVCVGFVGRLTRMKAPELMLDSFAVFRRHSRTSGRLVMVGDGPLAKALRARANDLGLGTDVIWLGAQDARPLMPGFDILALTSKSEGHPLVVLEAMARGLPIVATSVGGIAGTVQSGVNGFITPVGEAMAIASALEKLASDDALRTRMGQVSFAISQQFSADRMVERTLAFYEEVVTGVFAGKTNRLANLAASS